MFNFLIFYQRDLSLAWHFNEVPRGKAPMDDIESTVKNLSKVLSEYADIDTPNKFAEFANEISNVDYLFLSKEQLLKEPEEVAKAAPIPTILKIHKVKRLKERNWFVNKFYYFREAFGALFYSKVWCTQKYMVYTKVCGHKSRYISDDSIFNRCEDGHVAGEE